MYCLCAERTCIPLVQKCACRDDIICLACLNPDLMNHVNGGQGTPGPGSLLRQVAFMDELSAMVEEAVRLGPAGCVS